MKIFKVVLISFAILITVVILAGAIFIATFDVNRFKPQIISQANKALNRSFDFSKVSLGFNLRQGVNCKISGLVVSDNPDFSKESFLTIKEIFLGFDVLKYVFKNEVNIPDIIIDSPQVTIIRLKDGRINAQTLGFLEPQSIPSLVAEKAVSLSGPVAGLGEARQAGMAPGVQASKQMPAINVPSVKCSNGTIVYIDNSFEPALNVKISDLKFEAKATEKKVIVSEASAVIAQGSINASGEVDDYLNSQEFSLKANCQNIRIESLLSQEKSPVKIEGLVSGSVMLKGKGFDPEILKSSLSADGELSVIKAKLKDINLLRTVLDKISLIPGLSEKIESGLPDRFKQKLTESDTALSDIKFPFRVENRKMAVKDAIIGADEFLLKGSGEVDFEGACSLEGSFLIPQELSNAMVVAVPELQYLLNSDKEIYIPLKISGKAGELKFKVDAEYMGKKILVNQGTQQLFKAIEKALSGKKSSNNTNDQAVQPEEAQDNASSIEEAVGGILDKFLKKK